MINTRFYLMINHNLAKKKYFVLPEFPLYTYPPPKHTHTHTHTHTHYIMVLVIS